MWNPEAARNRRLSAVPAPVGSAAGSEMGSGMVFSQHPEPLLKHNETNAMMLPLTLTKKHEFRKVMQLAHGLMVLNSPSSYFSQV